MRDETINTPIGGIDILSLAGDSRARCQLSRSSVAPETFSAAVERMLPTNDKLNPALLSRIV
ncbi:hypothetical protein [Bradyrhizobium ottawaense]|uniref:hypothetical protein n=1 Tax=Bradyrhizobium ottawaense TaxID=931866 RepID=UPI003F9F9F1C